MAISRPFLRSSISSAAGFGMGLAVGPALTPLTQELANFAWSTHRSRPLDPAVAAALAVTGERSIEWAIDEAGLSGIDEDRLRALVDEADTGPDLGSLLELLRRGLIDEARFTAGVRRLQIEPDWVQGLAALETRPLSPAEAAAARQQGYIDEQRQLAESRLAGVDPERAQILFESAGLPPGPEAALTMLRRGIIDQATFEKMVREGNTKTKYTDEYLRLRSVPLSVAAAVSGTIRERWTADEGAAAAAKWGIERDVFDRLVDAGGRPPGIVQAANLVNRGVLTEAEFREVVARSNVRTEYADALLNLRVKYPTLFQLRGMVQSGGLDDQTALEWLHKQGYIDDVGAKILDVFKAGRTQTERDLIKGEILALYEGRLMGQTDAESLLGQLGYDPDEVAALLGLADARRYRRFFEAAVSKVKSQYVGHRISRTQAVTSLDALGVSAQARNDLLDVWDDELAASIATLSVAQITRALRNEVIGGQTAYDRLRAVGYGDEDARTIVSTVNQHVGGTGELPAALP